MESDRLLSLAYRARTPGSTALKELGQLASPGHMLTVRKGHAILYQQDPADDIYFLLKGTAVVMNDIPWKSDNRISRLVPLQAIGLIEYLNGDDTYTAYVIAETDCTLLKLTSNEFDHAIRKDHSLCYETLKLLGEMTKFAMNHSEMQHLLPPKDILGNHLYHLAKRSGIPYTYPNTRAALSADLQINLRTLYRYTDSLKQSGYLSLSHGKITISQEQFKRLSSRYSEQVL